MLKALLKIALLAICLLPTLSACSGDEPKTPEDNLPAETKKFVGVWSVNSSDSRVEYLELFANGKCVAFTYGDCYHDDHYYYPHTTGEWAYDTKTKMLSTSVGVQATTTLSTDKSWSGFSPSGTEYQCTRVDLSKYLFGGEYYVDYYSNALAVEMIKKISAASNLTTDEMLAKLAKQAYNDDLDSTDSKYGSVIYHGYYMKLNDKDDYYIKGTYSYYSKEYYGYSEYEHVFTVAEGKIIEIAQTANGYKVKLTYQDETLELTINPFK